MRDPFGNKLCFVGEKTLFRYPRTAFGGLKNDEEFPMLILRIFSGFWRAFPAAALALCVAPAYAQTTAPGFYFPPSSWDLVIPGAARFVVLSNFNGQAVLDVETGLVWEKSPGDTNGDGVVNTGDWLDLYPALSFCANKTIGGRKGWRVPSVVELTSLIDPSVVTFAKLPAGHPFVGVRAQDGFDDVYWSATSSTDPWTGRGEQWFVSFRLPEAGRGGPITGRYVWCVRAPLNGDHY